jgi:hypothetical protein
MMHCSSCDCPLPDATMRCTHCGEEVILPDMTPSDAREMKGKDRTIATQSRFPQKRSGPIKRLFSSLFNIRKFASQVTIHQTWLQPWHELAPLSIPLTEDSSDESAQLEDEAEVDSHSTRQMTWRKVVEPPPDRSPAWYPPRPMLPAVVQYIPLTERPESHRQSPTTTFWLCMFVLLVFIGAFGITGAAKRPSASFELQGPLSLLVTPQELAVGTMMSLRGTNFSPGGLIGLTRDDSIPILDTGGASITQSDAQGNFTDTVQVQTNWGSGSHIINAEDALTHKVTSFPVMISGESIALRPSHLQLSINSLNLGSDDEATNSKQTISLTNLGSGQISWQGSSTQSWLMMTPESGTFYSGTQNKVIIAVDRAHMQPGSYQAKMIFTSNVGNVPLDVNMQVTPLVAQNEGALQVSPPVLSFTGNDGGFVPTSQTVTISDPGARSLDWIGSTDVPWLSLSQSSGFVQPGGATQVAISADTRTLLPGTYSGRINFSAQGSGAVLHNLQSIDVTVTVTPYCDLMFSSGMLSFTAAYLQSDPPLKAVNLASSLSCPAPLSWNVTSSASWLTVSNRSGTTPSTLLVGVHLSGLGPGMYNGELTFRSSAGTQTLLVSFLLGPAGTPVMSVGSSSLTFSTVAGSISPAAQTVALTNSGARSLSWRAAAISQEGGSWLSISPVSGSLAAYQSTMLRVAVNTTGLPVGTYNGTVVITAVDSVTGQIMGPQQRVTVTVDIGPACTLQAPVPSTMQFSAVTGSNPAAQTFRIGVTGTCFGNVTVTPSVTVASGSGWLAVSPASAVIGSGQSATFSVAVTSAALKAGVYRGSISLSGVSDGVVIAGSSQTVKVTLTNQAAPAMQLSTTSLSFSTTVGTNPANQTIKISNVGGGTLNWSAGSPSQSWLSVTPTSGSCVAGSASTLTFAVNASGLAASTTAYQATVVITPSSGAAVTVTVTLKVNAANTPVSSVTATPVASTPVASTPAPTTTPS